MTCQDAIALLGDYLELALGAETIADLERHLGECAPCVAYLNTFRATRRVAAEAARVEMPEEMKERLRSFLLARLR
jgi:predicted anti-sigma-YlaC factor YlaD